MILAAGLGTRLRPMTNNLPKALIEINNIPLLEIAIKKLIKYGFDEIIINVHHFPAKIRAFLHEKKNFNIRIELSDETDNLLDTGGGLKKASWFFNSDEAFLVYNVDILSDIDLKQLINYHSANNSIAMLSVKKRNSSRYFLFDENNFLKGWKNVKSNETKIVRYTGIELKELAFNGIQILDPKIFALMPDKDTFSLVDLYLSAANKNNIFGFEDDSSFFLDVGKKENLIEAEKLIPGLGFDE